MLFSIVAAPIHILSTVYKSSFLSRCVKPLSHVWLFATMWIAACQTSLSITNSQSQLLASGGQSIRALASVLPMNIQG